MTELSEEQLNELGEELLERMVEAKKEETRQIIDGPVTELTPEAKSQLSPVGQEEVAGELAKAEHDPIVPPKMTRKVWKEMMRIHFTVRRPMVKGCGHKINIESDPRNNCDECWFAYFNNNGQMTKIADECFTEAGRDVLERSRGKKFVKYFLKFMSTIARFQREAAEREATNGVKVEGTTGEGSVETDSSIGGLAGETRSIGGVPEDASTASVGAQGPLDGGTTEGLGTGLSGL